MTRRRSGGFTLIELLVAIAAMALLALMSWRGIDSMGRAQAINRERADAVLTLQTSLAQWGADLDATVALAGSTAIDWNGTVLRLTRRSTDSATPVMYVVAWILRPGSANGPRWARWQSPGFSTHEGWQQAWDGAATWATDGLTASTAGADVALVPIDGWQLLYYRSGAWGPPLSAEAMGSTTPLPDGVRLILNLSAGSALSGALQRDWMRPTLAVPKS